MIKIDLHTHSQASNDGGIRFDEYVDVLKDGKLDCIAITDHNSISFAQQMRQTLGEQIIIGEEITTTNGEIIGLFLKRPVIPGQTPLETAKAIKDQGGLVYIPHPFETVRAGLTEEALNTIVDLIDTVEIHNGRAMFQNRGPKAATWAKLNHKTTVASSDAHGLKGLGTTYTQISAVPSEKTLVKLLKKGRFTTNRPPLRTLLYPKINRLSKRFIRA